MGGYKGLCIFKYGIGSNRQNISRLDFLLMKSPNILLFFLIVEVMTMILLVLSAGSPIVLSILSCLIQFHLIS